MDIGWAAPIMGIAIGVAVVIIGWLVVGAWFIIKGDK